MTRTRDYEQAYNDEVAGIDSAKEPTHFAGSVTIPSIGAGETATISLQPNMEMNISKLIVSDAHAPNIELIDATVGPINLNAGDGPVPGDAFRANSNLRILAAVPVLPNQPLRTRWRNKSATAVTNFGFTIAGKVKRS